VLGGFDYVRPRSIEAACRALAEAESPSILAGGTDLLVEIRNGFRSPDLLIDVKGIDELGQFDTDGKEWIVGATVPLNVLAERRAVRDALPALADAALSIGTYQLRNRATLAGNLCNASPAADSAPVLMTIGASVSVAGPDGRRTVPVSKLFTGVKRTCLLPDEIATDLHIPRPERHLRTAFLKQQRIRGHDLAVVNVAGAYDPSPKRLRIAIGSCAPTPVLLEPIDGSGSTAAVVAHAVELAAAATSPISDVRASADYRRAILPVLLRRLIELLRDGGGAP